MRPLFAGLLLGLLVVVILRRLRINSVERKLADERAGNHEASTFLVFVRELKAIAADPAQHDAMLEDIVALITKAAGATSGAFFKLAHAGVLERVAVVGSHPAQTAGGSATGSRASGIAASMGEESVGLTHGVAGQAAHDCRTAILPPNPGEVARVAVPVSSATGVAGVISIAGPCTGGAFAPRGVALIERLVAAARPVLLQSGGIA